MASKLEGLTGVGWCHNQNFRGRNCQLTVCVIRPVVVVVLFRSIQSSIRHLEKHKKVQFLVPCAKKKGTYFNCEISGQRALDGLIHEIHGTGQI